MIKELTLGSLFDGSGGFPLAAIFCGIKPIWASEVEPFPIRVTQKNLPQVRHLGDIKDIDGTQVDFVDVISFGSPCQDLSIAGRRAGLEGNKSNLFYEAIRVVKEMRCKTNGKYPRYLVWENVPGAFSSNKGEDFRSVLEEITKVKDSNSSIPKPKRWCKSGEIVGDGFSIAWRILDAKYFGVPQRRRRIFLVADLRGGCAGEILFEQTSLPRDTKKSKEKGKRNPNTTERSFNKSICLNDQGGERMDIYEEISGTLKARGGNPPFVYENHSQDSRYNGPITNAPTLASNLGQGGNNQPFVVYDIRQTSENTKNERHNIYKCDVSRT
ncbi:MAG: DNA cytosine methyltransferase, partial [Tissierellia bacterium]|nr:DNA cytosine methyltransferase [Tissierellia bacterium]